LKWVLDRSKKNSDVEAISLKKDVAKRRCKKTLQKDVAKRRCKKTLQKDVAKRQINEIWICFLKNGEIGYNLFHDVSTPFF
jgi:hypothetical protein